MDNDQRFNQNELSEEHREELRKLKEDIRETIIRSYAILNPKYGHKMAASTVASGSIHTCLFFITALYTAVAEENHEDELNSRIASKEYAQAVFDSYFEIVNEEKKKGLN